MFVALNVYDNITLCQCFRLQICSCIKKFHRNAVGVNSFTFLKHQIISHKTYCIVFQTLNMFLHQKIPQEMLKVSILLPFYNIKMYSLIIVFFKIKKDCLFSCALFCLKSENIVLKVIFSLMQVLQYLVKSKTQDY